MAGDLWGMMKGCGDSRKAAGFAGMGLTCIFLSNFILKTNLVFWKSSFCYNVDIIGGDLSHKLKVMFLSFGYFQRA